MSDLPAKPLAPRHAELLADRAVWGLAADEAAELDAAGLAHDESFDLAAAAADLAYFAPHRASARMPDALRARIEADALARVASAHAPIPAPIPFPSRPNRLPWLVAACALFAAAAAWWPGAPKPPDDPAELRTLSLRAGAAPLAWTDFAHPATHEAPEITGVRGDVVWDEHAQKGFMRLEGLPVNNPAVERYQLWIIDERGLEQRVNAGLFDVARTGELIIPFSPDLPIRRAAIFAVTIEKPEGVVVSDLKRRACAALVPPPGT